MAKGSTLKNETLLKKNLQDLEELRIQLEEHNFGDLCSEEGELWQYYSPSSLSNNMNSKQIKQRDLLISGDKGGSSIMRKNARQNNLDYDSDIMPRKLNLKIHTNIDDDFEIHSSEDCSIIDNIQEHPYQLTQEVGKQSLQATEETLFIVCDDKNNSELLISTSNKNNNSNYQPEAMNEQSEQTVIEYNDIQSCEDYLNLNESSKNNYDEELSSIKDCKRPKSYHEIINQPCSQPDLFRRVESTSSFKRLPKISHLDTDNDSIQNQSNSECIIERNSVKHSKPIHHRVNKNIYTKQVNHLEFQLEESFNEEIEVIQNSSPPKLKRNSRDISNPKSSAIELNNTKPENLKIDLFNRKGPFEFTKSDAMATPKERDDVPCAFKRNQSKNSLITSQGNTQNLELLQLRKDNSKLKREIEKLLSNHQSEVTILRKYFEDELAQSLRENEKEYALILDAKLIEYEESISETQQRQRKEQIEKFAKYQETIDRLGKENNLLQDENRKMK